MDIVRLFFLPPLAIARVGGSEFPLESFAWDTGRTIADANRTIIRPTVSFEVLADGVAGGRAIAQREQDVKPEIREADEADRTLGHVER